MDLRDKMKGWEAFRDAGLLWWVNRILHTFGWAIVIAEEEEDGTVFFAWPESNYPAFGFPPEVDEEKLDAFRSHIERPSAEDRLRDERDRLRNEVVALRGHRGHDYQPVEDQPLGERQVFVCTRCGHRSEAPVHAYFGGNAVCLS
jgi:hypothetical protein